MPSARNHPADLSPQTLAAQCETRRTRRSGPGGQNRNKVETAIVLWHPPSGVGAEASERRTQGENLKVALFRMRVNLALEVRCPFAPHEEPSALWRSRCPLGRIVVNPEHDDFPSLLAEALDVIESSHLDVKNAAAILGCTTSQLTKFLKNETRALLHVNEKRRALGLHPLL